MRRVGVEDDARMRQRDLPIEQLETSDGAYLSDIAACGWRPTTEKLAVWIFEHGKRARDAAGARVQAVAVPGRRRLAKLVDVSVGSLEYAIEKLKTDGPEEGPVMIETGGCLLLHLGRVVALAETRATAGSTQIEFPGWSNVNAAEPGLNSPEQVASVHRRSPAVHSRSPGVHRRSPPRRTEKDNTNTTPKPHRTEPNRGGSGGGGDPAGDGRERKRLLNATAAWRDVTDEVMRELGSNRSIRVLREAFHAAVEQGVLDDLPRVRRDFLATAHSAAAGADKPAGAFVWRIASGKVRWCDQADYDWADRILARSADRRPTGEAATVAASLAGRLHEPAEGTER
jgi:hypothetical protein